MLPTLSSSLTPLESKEGLERLKTSCGSGATSLIDAFRQQSGNTLCGAATLAVLYNSLHGRIAVSDIQILQMCSHRKDVLSSGMTLHQAQVLAKELFKDTADVNLSLSTQDADARNICKNRVIEHLNQDQTRVCVNYHMTRAGQPPYGGHFAPIAAYHAATESFLIMDGWPLTSPAWINWDDLYASTCMLDSASEKPRGFLFFRQTSAPPATTASPITSLESLRDRLHSTAAITASIPLDIREIEGSKSSQVQATLGYIDEGDASSGHTLVLLHGSLGGTELFRPSINYWTARGVRVLAMDFPGYGRNQHLSPLTTVVELTNLMHRFINQVYAEAEATSNSKLSMLGYDLGGLVALQLLQRGSFLSSTRVHRLVLYGTCGHGALLRRYEPLEETLRKMSQTTKTADSSVDSDSCFVREYLECMKAGFYDFQDKLLPQHWSLCVASARCSSLEAIKASFTAMTTWGDHEKLAAMMEEKKLSIPTLIIWGEYDKVVETCLFHRLRDSIQHPLCSILPAAGHFAHLDRADAFSENIQLFLKEETVPQFRYYKDYFTVQEMAQITADDAVVQDWVLKTMPTSEARPNLAIYRLTCGLVHNVRSAIKRCMRRSIFIRPSDSNIQDEYYHQKFFSQVQNLLYPRDKEAFQSTWTPKKLWAAAEELTTKRGFLVYAIQVSFDCQPFMANYASHLSTDTLLGFDYHFLCKVRKSLGSLRRPDLTSDEAELSIRQSPLHGEAEAKVWGTSCNATPKIPTAEEYGSVLHDLRLLGREKCPKCGVNKFIYCSHCNGLRMPRAETILPERIDLEVFDVTVLLHWTEKPSICTSLTAAVMCLPDAVRFLHWPKNKFLETIVSEIDCSKDLLLFPGDNAVDMSSLDWKRLVQDTESQMHDGKSDHRGSRGGTSGGPIGYRKRRLIVIESNWTSGKTMYQELMEALTRTYGDKTAKQLRCIKFSNLVGQYWRFQDVGHSMVSTIEAIYHTASIANAAIHGVDTREYSIHNTNDLRHLLILFQLQRERMLQERRAGDKVGLPRALNITGNGNADWNTNLNLFGIGLPSKT